VIGPGEVAAVIEAQIAVADAKATAPPGKVRTEAAAHMSAAHVRTAETATHVAASEPAAHMSAAEAAAHMATTSAHVTATAAAARKRVSCQSPGERGSRCQNDHCLS